MPLDKETQTEYQRFVDWFDEWYMIEVPDDVRDFVTICRQAHLSRIDMTKLLLCRLLERSSEGS